MPAEKTRCDAMREYLTGAASDGGSQPDATLSLGHFRSSTEAASLGISIASAVVGATIDFAGGLNGEGDGTLTVVDANTLKWLPPGDTVDGEPVAWTGAGVKILEGTAPGKYLRVTGSPPFSGGPAILTLAAIVNNQFGEGGVTEAQAAAGVTQYRASIVRNESTGSVGSWIRWIGELADSQLVAVGGSLGSSGLGTLTTSGTFDGWPEAGWCQVRSSLGVLRELVYYTSRTSTILTVPAAGRGLLGTTPGAGSLGDRLHSVPGVAIGADSAGFVNHGTAIQTIADEFTTPTGVTWSLGITQAGGVVLGSMSVGKQIGIWVKRQHPAGSKATPGARIVFEESFNVF